MFAVKQKIQQLEYLIETQCERGIATSKQLHVGHKFMELIKSKGLLGCAE